MSGADELIITPGTQGALFLALGATVNAGDRVAIVRPDYFANRKLVEFLGGVIVPVEMDYLSRDAGAGLDLVYTDWFAMPASGPAVAQVTLLVRGLSFRDGGVGIAGPGTVQADSAMLAVSLRGRP